MLTVRNLILRADVTITYQKYLFSSASRCNILWVLHLAKRSLLDFIWLPSFPQVQHLNAFLVYDTCGCGLTCLLWLKWHCHCCFVFPSLLSVYFYHFLRHSFSSFSLSNSAVICSLLFSGSRIVFSNTYSPWQCTIWWERQSVLCRHHWLGLDCASRSKEAFHWGEYIRLFVFNCSHFVRWIVNKMVWSSEMFSGEKSGHEISWRWWWSRWQRLPWNFILWGVLNVADDHRK